MKKSIIALLFLFLALVPLQTVSAAEAVSSEDYFATVDGENEEIHYEVYKVTTSDTTLPSCSPGAVKFNYIQGNTYQAATPSPSVPQKLQSVVLNEIKITDDKGNFSSVTLSSPIVLNGFGDVRDCIMKKDGVWGVERKIAEVVLDGSETWSKSSTVFRFSTSTLKGAVKPTESDTVIANMLCTHHKVISAQATYRQNDGFAVDSNGKIYIYSTEFTEKTVDEWKAHLAENPITVLYELADPIIEALPIADQIALDKLETFQGTCYVTFDSAIFPVFQLEYSSFVPKVYDPHLEAFVGFMKAIFDFVATEFTIWGFTFSYWQIIILSCLASVVGYFIHEVFS